MLIYDAGCHEILSSDECCKYVDGRIDNNYRYYLQQCVAVENVVSPSHDVNHLCQPLCFAKNECEYRFVGTISNYCHDIGNKI